jgi:predicted negative regulator of RcsB-dependent stress response
MDEYLSEKEQAEQLRGWLKTYGPWIIGGVVAGALALAGVDAWRSHRLAQAEAASALYQTLATAAGEGRLDAAGEALDSLAAEHAAAPYVSQGRLVLAAAQVEADNTAEAVRLLETVMDEAQDPELALVARLRLARLFATTGDAERALALTEAKAEGPFGAALAEVRGDVLAARGDAAGARAAYTSALEGAGAGAIDEAFIRMKLEALGLAGEDEAS